MPQPGYFKEGVLNSFPDEIARAKFCNKFYQCLLAGKIRAKRLGRRYSTKLSQRIKSRQSGRGTVLCGHDKGRHPAGPY